jgi:hypothetical protein
VQIYYSYNFWPELGKQSSLPAEKWFFLNKKNVGFACWRALEYPSLPVKNSVHFYWFLLKKKFFCWAFSSAVQLPKSRCIGLGNSAGQVSCKNIIKKCLWVI